MRLLILAVAALGLASPVLANHPACEGDPRCGVLDEDHPALQGKNGAYHDSGYIYMSRQKIERHPECAAKIYRHERKHREQHAAGKDYTSEWSEAEARDAVPDMYGCASKRPGGTLNNYAPRSRW